MMINVAIPEQWDVVDHATGYVYLEAVTPFVAISWIAAEGGGSIVEVHRYQNEDGHPIIIIFV
jgi:hypothetical protein